jgi:alpha-L-fucosidase
VLLCATFLLLAIGRVLASDQTALDRYVAAPDPSYEYHVVSSQDSLLYKTFVLEMTSQTWLTKAEVDKPVWKHWLTITVPKKVSTSTALIIINGGANDRPAPKAGDNALALGAVSTQSVVADVKGIPSEPLVFADEGKNRTEDAIIAYSWDKYLRTQDDRWPLRLPMTKAVVRAMDTVQSFLKSDAGGNVKIEDFAVAGGSKRGWTTWTVAAVDKRVRAIVPIVIDTLHLEAAPYRQFAAYGTFSPAVKDYTDINLGAWAGTPQFHDLMKIEDPYNYRDRYTMPKLLINSTGDQYFLPDNSQFYFSDLPGTKYLRYVPNTDHSLGGSDAVQSMLAFYAAILNNSPLPRFTWDFTPDGVTIHTEAPPAAVKFWQANNPTARDFRLAVLGRKWTSTDVNPTQLNTYSAKVDNGKQGWTAFMMELTFPNGSLPPLKFTTPVRVTPDTLPFADKVEALKAAAEKAKQSKPAEADPTRSVHETAAVGAPKPYGPLPSQRQLESHLREFYGFLHFTVNTFTDKEWGYGDEKESVFNPTDFDADQIAQTAKMAGMSGLILTAKHHDGFCLWPSKYTEHSVKNSPWKDGKGDVVKEMSEACRRAGIKFGVYLSPWDRNFKDYAHPAYIEYYRNQLRELLTNYGDIFEVWFDGANGGDGYYGGAREMRRIDNSVYYDWPNTIKIVRELMPNACMFSDSGPDMRWVGNERGTAGETCWETLDLTAPRRYPGGSSAGLNTGQRPGTAWLPAECDVSIRPGWFYHEKEDARVKTPAQLLDIYYKSVGRGANLNLNLPPDRRGRINDHDIASLKEFRRILDATFAHDLAQGAKLTPSNIRGNDPQFAPEHLLDNNRDTYWSTDDAVTTPELTVDLGKPTTFNVISLREFLPLGQRIEAFALDQWKDGKWQEFAHATSIGNRRLIRTQPVTTDKLRLRITQAPVCPALSEFAVYAEPSSK